MHLCDRSDIGRNYCYLSGSDFDLTLFSFDSAMTAEVHGDTSIHPNRSLNHLPVTSNFLPFFTPIFSKINT